MEAGRKLEEIMRVGSNTSILITFISWLNGEVQLQREAIGCGIMTETNKLYPN